MKINYKLIKGIFISRPNRFITLIKIGGEIHRSHLADPGRLNELLYLGVKVLVYKASKKLNRKTKYSTMMVYSGSELVSLVTTLPNYFIKDSLVKRDIPLLEKYKLIKPEVTLGKHRIDFLLKDSLEKYFYLEVKSVTYVENNIAKFPDAITLRGRNHVDLLNNVVISGGRAGILFVCQRSDAKVFEPMWDRDKLFCKALLNAKNNGLKIWCISLKITNTDITFNKEIEVNL